MGQTSDTSLSVHVKFNYTRLILRCRNVRQRSEISTVCLRVYTCQRKSALVKKKKRQELFSHFIVYRLLNYFGEV